MVALGVKQTRAESQPCLHQPRTEKKKFRNYDVYTSSPFHIPNSQAPVPGQDVFWNLDTPQSKKEREKLLKKLESVSTPESEKKETEAKNALPSAPPLWSKSVPSLKGHHQDNSVRKVASEVGEKALLGLMALCKNEVSMNGSNTTTNSLDMFDGDVDAEEESTRGERDWVRFTR